MKVLRGQNVSGLCLGEVLEKEGPLLVEGHEGPTPSPAPLPVESGWTDGVVFPQPFPYRLNRDHEQIRDAMGGKPGRVRQPNRQPSLIGALLRRLLDPGHELVGREPGRQARRLSHRVPLGK
ncbi:hypothetical protein GALL_551450 [mine drainage metagenome]|uniref:Uncharacterized protein n=1 Tax=mine drainage metagenome TaxID=410659 RepID=A0A1J5PDK6_9ZZZZ